MDRQKTVFDYVAEVLKIYGFMVATFLPFVLCFGRISREVSALFSLGTAGLSVSSLAQLLLLSVCLVCLRFVFFTEKVIRRAGLLFRSVAMISSVVLVIILFVVVFRWFPARMPIAWLSFAVCFAVCFLLSLLILSCKERLENRKMADALEKMKRGDA